MFVIYDPRDEGYVMNGPIEGWHFTILLSAAARFETEEKARKAITDHYRYTGPLEVRQYEAEKERTKSGPRR